MSAFDDEFGLFDDDEARQVDDERRSTLGARILTSGETIIDEIEMDDGDRPRARRHRNEAEAKGPAVARRGKPLGVKARPGERRPAGGPVLPVPRGVQDRAIALLTFLATGLVSKPERLSVAAREDARHGLVLNLQVAPEDLGKVIGRGGRVAHALRTVLRAAAEGRVMIEIVEIVAEAPVADASQEE
jgi:predicted RNA-binding protein YlqC (UPF0109 family)